jgi:hypothetical protein
MTHSLMVTGDIGALGDFCPIDGTQMKLVKKEDHISYGGGYYLYFLKCQRKHKWLMIITQYDEFPPSLLSGWKTELNDENLEKSCS